MTIGYAHVGAPEHGVSRYGRLLAAEARARPNLRVLESDLRLTGEPGIDRQRVVEAGRRLAGADLVHVQYNTQLKGCLWGAGWRSALHLILFARTVRAPLVVTLHDVCSLPRPRWIATARHPAEGLRRACGLAPQIFALRWLGRRASRLLVCSQAERARMSSQRGRVGLIPHFVEPRTRLVSPAGARAALGLGGKRVVTLLGYIHERKGHALAIDALAALPQDVTMVFAGSAADADSPFSRALRARAAHLGVAGRLRITGYLSDDDLARHLAATDVALCPFLSLSASGSLSTWISAGRPVVASDLPQIAEYNAMEPGAIRTFRPLTAAALAEAVRAALAAGPADGTDAIARLRRRLLLPAVFDCHLDLYRELLAQPRAAKLEMEEQWASER